MKGATERILKSRLEKLLIDSITKMFTLSHESWGDDQDDGPHIRISGIDLSMIPTRILEGQIRSHFEAWHLLSINQVELGLWHQN